MTNETLDVRRHKGNQGSCSVSAQGQEGVEARRRTNTSTKAGHQRLRGKLSAGQDGTRPMRSPWLADAEYIQHRAKKWESTGAADTVRRVVGETGRCLPWLLLDRKDREGSTRAPRIRRVARMPQEGDFGRFFDWVGMEKRECWAVIPLPVPLKPVVGSRSAWVKCSKSFPAEPGQHTTACTGCDEARGVGVAIFSSHGEGNWRSSRLTATHSTALRDMGCRKLGFYVVWKVGTVLVAGIS